MLNNFRNLNSLYQSLGARWLLFRVAYALRVRTGLLRRQIPSYHWEDRPLETWLKKGIPSQPDAYAQWRKQHLPKFLFEKTILPDAVPWDPQVAVEEAERILNGELKYFAHKFVRTGFPPDWHTDPVSRKKVDATRHWSAISNEGDVDIKLIWEASRFSLVYTLVRAYASTRDRRFAEAFWELIRAWAAANPPNTGPNWMDGQEAALRLMGWTFGFYAFRDSSATTSGRIAQFTALVAAHAERIHKNIAYAISTRGNHIISEAFGLWLASLLFPELRDAEKYSTLGRKLLEQEAAAQIFSDGSYSMYSLNYHRFILHIYLFAMRLAELNKVPFSREIYERVSTSMDYLYELIDPETGQMPIYGSNDGALVLPLNNCDFTDFRPLLQLGGHMTQGVTFFEAGSWDEDIFWFFGGMPFFTGAREQKIGKAAFAHGGVYLVRGAHSKAVIRCTHFRSRPSHADQLHVDLWWRGRNIACDAGTYLYSGEGIWRNGLAHTSVHNTVTVDGRDQMRMVSRFTWTDWAKGKVLRHTDAIWQGEHDGYRHLPDPVHHKRTVLSLDEDRWLVVDHLNGKGPHHYALHWLLADARYERGENLVVLLLDSMKYKVQIGLLQGNAAFSVTRAEEDSVRGWRSRYYAEKEPALSILLETNQAKACYWTFFGFESDSVECVGETLHIRSGSWETAIHLAELEKGTSSFAPSSKT